MKKIFNLLIFIIVITIFCSCNYVTTNVESPSSTGNNEITTIIVDNPKFKNFVTTPQSKYLDYTKLITNMEELKYLLSVVDLTPIPHRFNQDGFDYLYEKGFLALMDDSFFENSYISIFRFTRTGPMDEYIPYKYEVKDNKLNIYMNLYKKILSYDDYYEVMIMTFISSKHVDKDIEVIYHENIVEE